MTELVLKSWFEEAELMCLILNYKTIHSILFSTITSRFIKKGHRKPTRLLEGNQIHKHHRSRAPIQKLRTPAVSKVN